MTILLGDRIARFHESGTADPSPSPDFLSDVVASVHCNVVLFDENHTSGTGESGEAGNPGSLGMTKERVMVH
jgi:hypothetical protein